MKFDTEQQKQTVLALLKTVPIEDMTMEKFLAGPSEDMVALVKALNEAEVEEPSDPGEG